MTDCKWRLELPVNKLMKNKSGRSIWFRRYFVGGLYPSTIEGIALLLGVVAAVLSLPYGSEWLINAGSKAGLTSSLFLVVGLVGYALIPVIVIGFIVVAYRHSGPPD